MSRGGSRNTKRWPSSPHACSRGLHERAYAPALLLRGRVEVLFALLSRCVHTHASSWCFAELDTNIMHARGPAQTAQRENERASQRARERARNSVAYSTSAVTSANDEAESSVSYHAAVGHPHPSRAAAKLCSPVGLRQHSSMLRRVRSPRQQKPRHGTGRARARESLVDEHRA